MATSPPPHEGSQHSAEPGLYEARNALGKVISSSNYVLRLLSSGTLSPLIGVNRDAKEAVYNRYRVHVPSVGRQVYDGRGTPSVRFCPEDDTICISLEPTADPDNNAALFAHFVHDTVAYDPRNAGVLHIAIANNGLPSDIALPLDPQSLHSRARGAFVQILSRLRSVSLLHLVGGDARKMYSSLQFARTAPNPIESVRSCPEEVRFNRAFPIWSSTASFSVLRQDPRPITQYLDIVCLTWDPRAIIRAWRTLEATYSIPPTASKKMRVLVAAASDMDGHEFASRGEALRARVHEEALWKDRWAEGGPFYQKTFPCPDTKASLEYARVHNAVGFWSIPLGVFGEVPEVDYTTHHWVQPLVLDLRQYESQIELGLFELPK
ncbi:unnamed protein product [Clonostachys rosea]|uniref:Uncharacterized protein n=1 Tax=Bionectria ochroleuca TaxID=29856 RepID=A0ABY6UFK4_BIOOC|nr:unnamed protein product [Clonostachys rosea]